MSGAVAAPAGSGAPAATQASTGTQPAAPSPEAKPARRTGGDPFDVARKDLAERKRLRLVQKPAADGGNEGAGEEHAGQRAEERRETIDRETNAEHDDTASERDEHANASDEPADEAKPHWAKKLKAERDELHAKHEAIAKEKQAWESERTQMKIAHDDAQDETKFQGGVAREIYSLLRSIPRMQSLGRDAQGRPLFTYAADGRGGIAYHDVDATSGENMRLQREIEKQKRQLARGQGKDVDSRSAELSKDLQARFAAVFAKYPDLDRTKNNSPVVAAAVKDFVEDELHRWQRSGGKWEGVEERAARFALAVKSQLAAQANAGRPSKPGTPPKPNRPNNEAPRRQGGTVERGGRRVQEYVSNKMIKEELAAHRARRG